MSLYEITRLTAGELLQRFRDGSLSPVEAANATLDRIRSGNKELNAYCLVDEESALEQAKRAEQRYQRGEAKGFLEGVPIAVKDVFLTRGWPTLKGSRAIDPGGPWETDSPSVAAMRRHGGVFIGKTTTPELGWKGVTDSPLTGVSRNPWNMELTCGGSSGGSAAALAAGMAALAPGTDAGGSIRMPASFCGVVGLKPTHARVPMWPASAFAPLAHVGPMARTVQDTALLMNALDEWDFRDTSALPPHDVDYVAELQSGVGRVRAAYSPDLGYVSVDPQVAGLVEVAVAAMERLGVDVDRVDPGFPSPLEAFETLFNGGAANALRVYDEAQRSRMDPGLVRAAEAAAGLSLLDYLAANETRVRLSEHMSQFHQNYDLLITPTLPILPFAVGRNVPLGWSEDDWPTWTPFTYPFNLTGQPAISMPCGFTAEGLPVGIQLVAAKYQDALVLRAAYALQEALSLDIHWPE